jgi:SDR family mycofactocin-dependent oxidoreductase
MGQFDGKTVLVSGAARGQGRSHAVRFAQEGASVVVFDICAQIGAAPYPLAGPAELDETVRLIQSAGGTVVAGIADVRDFEQVDALVRLGIDVFGGIDVVVANAGIFGAVAKVWEIEPTNFQAVVDVDLVGVWHTFRAALPSMVAAGRGGCIIATASGAAVKGTPNLGPYVAAKHGLVGLVKTTARELAPHGIRANAVLPGNTDTPMFRSDAMMRAFVPEADKPDEQEFLNRAANGIPMGIPFVEAGDITEAVLWLSSDRARYVTGVALSVDGGGAIP